MNGAGLSEEPIERIRSILADHDVSFALVFGSAAHESMGSHSDIDVAIEFDSLRPTDAGYSDAYLRLRTALDAALEAPVDVVDVHTMEPQFGSTVFDEGALIRGTEARKAELAEQYDETAASLADARANEYGRQSNACKTEQLDDVRGGTLAETGESDCGCNRGYTSGNISSIRVWGVTTSAAFVFKTPRW